MLRALSQGGAGFLLKDSAPAELIQAVRAAAAGDTYLSPSAARHVVDSLASGQAAVRCRTPTRESGSM